MTPAASAFRARLREHIRPGVASDDKTLGQRLDGVPFVGTSTPPAPLLTAPAAVVPSSNPPSKAGESQGAGGFEQQVASVVPSSPAWAAGALAPARPAYLMGDR
jgi:hypothetical protein